MSEAVESRALVIEESCPHGLVLEQVMRLCADDALAWAFATVCPLSTEFLAAMGRLLSTCSLRLPPGSPLLVWAGVGVLDPHWRDHCQNVAQSVWGELVMLRTLAGSQGTPDPLGELEALRAAVL